MGCDLCGEEIENDANGFSIEETGEFTGNEGEAVVAHAQCGLDAGLSLA